jgi:hypothetical protein
MQEPLITNDDLQKQFDAAAREGMSPCAWLPPTWSELMSNKFYGADKEPGKFFDTVSKKPDKLDDNVAAQNCVKAGEAADYKELYKAETVPGKEAWVDPFSDFWHIDNSEFPSSDLETIANELPSNALNSKILDRLRCLVGPGAPGMRRLERVFDWVVYRTTDLLGDLNTAAKNQNQDDYEKARKNYIEFLKDLDDHEPQRKNKKIDPLGVDEDDPKKIKRKKLRKGGYGRTIKWTCINPVIFEGKIYGARVICHWNPHSSSNGIPVQHP